MLGLNKEQLLGFLRHIITFVGGILVARGKLDPVAVESIGGAIITLVGLGFSLMTPEKQATPVAQPQVQAQPLSQTTSAPAPEKLG